MSEEGLDAIDLRSLYESTAYCHRCQRSILLLESVDMPLGEVVRKARAHLQEAHS